MTRSFTAGVSLWRHRDFLLLWIGQAISDLGSATTLVALPLVAVTMVSASPFEVGVLTALGTVGWLVVSLPAGVVIDRLRMRVRTAMILCDIGRVAVLISVPLVAVLGHLGIWHLYAAALLLGLLAVFFEVACQSYVPALLSRTQLVDGVSRIGTTNALAAVVGPPLAGALIAVHHNTAGVLWVGCLSFAMSITSLLLIRRAEEGQGIGRVGAWTSTLGRDLVAGLRFVLMHRVLRRTVACSATANAFDIMSTALIVVFLVRDLDADPATIGLVLGIGSTGGVVGGFVANPMSRLLGPARALWMGKLILGPVALCIPFAGPGWGVALVSVGLFTGGVVTVSYNVLQIAYRQSICPPALRGRMNASVRWAIRGLMPAGGVLAGTLAHLIGVRATLAVAVLGSWLAVLWIVFSPLRRERDLPSAVDVLIPGEVAPTVRI